MTGFLSTAPEFIAGDDVYASIIDDFEDNDLSEYDTSDGPNFSVTSNQVYNGSYSLEVDWAYDASTAREIISTSGLPNYPSKGDTFAWWWRMDGSDGIKNTVAFNWIDADNHYALNNNQSSGGPNFEEVRLFRVSGGEGTEILATGGDGSFNASGNTWYEFEIAWNTDDTFDLTIRDINGNTVASGSGSDGSPLSSVDGLYFDGTGDSVYGSNSNFMWIDYMGIK